MQKGKRFSDKRFAESFSLPFWSWNDKLETERLESQISDMKDKKIGGFFMHARAGLKTEYLSDEWFDCIRACCKKAKELGMEPWAYDENGWPSGFVGGELLNDECNLENYLEFSIGDFDEKAFCVYDIQTEKLERVFSKGGSSRYLNLYKRTAVSSVDVADKSVVDKFIALTHERYKKELGEEFKTLKGFFTDEPQLCRKATVFPHLMQKAYKELYNEDVLDGLGLLFIEKQGYRTFRYRYWSLCQKLFLENFAKNIYDWCEDNGVKLTGHYIEERDIFSQMLYNEGIMPFYEFEHVPGIDWLCKRFMSIVPVRQLTSACVQLGKTDVLTETYAMTGWNATPSELKAITEFQFFYGVNKMCQHLLPYSERGERKDDYPTHTSDINPWMKAALADYNDYFNRLGGIIRGSEEFVNVAVLHPVRSAYFNFKHGDYASTKELDQTFISLSNYLAKNGIGFNYVDETLLFRHGFVNGAKLGCGKKQYDYLIIPKCYTMDINTEKLIREFYDNGGKVLFAYEKPEYLEGEKFDYSYINSNVTLDEIIKAQPYKFETFSDSLFPVYRKCGDFDCLLVLNIDDDKCAEFTAQVDGVMSEYNFETGEEFACDGKSFTIKPLQSKMFIIDRSRKSALTAKPNLAEYVLPCGGFDVVESDDNAFVLDRAELSYDGTHYTEKQWVAGIFDGLLNDRYEGDLYLKFTFDAKVKPQKIALLSEFEKAEITVNGNPITFGDTYYVYPEMKTCDIAPYVKAGVNEIIVKLYFYENEKVYYALFGENVTESLRNCLVYDTYIEGMKLFGDFGVYTDLPMQQSENRDTLYADDFYIGEKPSKINELISDGFPFFSGKVVLSKKFYLDDKNVSLKINGRMHFARVYINGKHAGNMLFNDSVDISAFAKKGENVLKIEIYTSARNLLGAHHDTRFAESGGVTPYAFGFRGSWKNGKSLLERKSYSLVRTGVFNPDMKEWYHL